LVGWEGGVRGDEFVGGVRFCFTFLAGGIEINHRIVLESFQMKWV